MNRFTDEQLRYEVEKQTHALKELVKWGFSLLTLFLVMAIPAWWGFRGNGWRFAAGVTCGIIAVLIGIILIILIIGIIRGIRNVRKIQSTLERNMKEAEAGTEEEAEAVEEKV